MTAAASRVLIAETTPESSACVVEIIFSAAGETLRIASAVPGVVEALGELGYPEHTGRPRARHDRVFYVGEDVSASGPFLFVDCNGERVAVGDWHAVVAHLVGEVRSFTYQRTTRDLHLHAVAVSLDGVGILLPGESRSGKSALALALLGKACRYLADDPSILEPTTLTLKRGNKTPAVNASALLEGADAWSPPCELGLIVFPRFCDTSPVVWRALERGEAARQLLQLCSNLRWNTRELIELVVMAVQKVESFAMTFGDARQAAASIVQAVRSRSDRPRAGAADFEGLDVPTRDLARPRPGRD